MCPSPLTICCKGAPRDGIHLLAPTSAASWPISHRFVLRCVQPIATVSFELQSPSRLIPIYVAAHQQTLSCVVSSQATIHESCYFIRWFLLAMAPYQDLPACFQFSSALLQASIAAFSSALFVSVFTICPKSPCTTSRQKCRRHRSIEKFQA